LNIKDNSSLQKENQDNIFLQISEKLKDILNYYREIKNDIKNNILNTLEETIKKFDNVDSRISFLGNIKNDNFFIYKI